MNPELPIPGEQAPIKHLYDILACVPFLHVSKPIPAHRQEGELIPMDGYVQVHHGKNQWWLPLEFKHNAQIRDARKSIDYLNRVRKALGKSYPVFASQYLSQSIKDLCIENNIGYFDFSGNCRLVFDDVFIDRERVSEVPERKRLKSLFSPKSSRVIRRLLHEPHRPWKVQQLAEFSMVSAATVSLIKDKLIGEEYAAREGEAFIIAQPEKLLLDWSQFYNSKGHSQFEYFAEGEVPEIERRFAEFCRKESLKYAFTMFSGARRIANFTRGIERAYTYLAAYDPLELANALNLKRVASGGNFCLLFNDDTDVLYERQNVDGDYVVSDIQLYLDLASHKGRGEENAEFLLERRLRPRW